jgi:alkaline phosphatase
MRRYLKSTLTIALTGAAVASGASAQPFAHPPRAKNVILFVGDGMGVSTVSATRVLSVGVDGNLVLDQFPHTALARTARRWTPVLRALERHRRRGRDGLAQ